ncbi:hypothetical protein HDU76_013247 [Blyttiomyces sp. JEL0837]|nr:hypothetical protein HDU76_013247 [Blyttiomyces sp. JEL0837]
MSQQQHKRGADYLMKDGCDIKPNIWLAKDYLEKDLDLDFIVFIRMIPSELQAIDIVRRLSILGYGEIAFLYTTPSPSSDETYCCGYAVFQTQPSVDRALTDRYFHMQDPLPDMSIRQQRKTGILFGKVNQRDRENVNVQFCNAKFMYNSQQNRFQQQQSHQHRPITYQQHYNNKQHYTNITSQHRYPRTSYSQEIRFGPSPPLYLNNYPSTYVPPFANQPHRFPPHVHPYVTPMNQQKPIINNVLGIQVSRQPRINGPVPTPPLTSTSTATSGSALVPPPGLHTAPTAAPALARDNADTIQDTATQGRDATDAGHDAAVSGGDAPPRDFASLATLVSPALSPTAGPSDAQGATPPQPYKPKRRRYKKPGSAARQASINSARANQAAVQQNLQQVHVGSAHVEDVTWEVGLEVSEFDVVAERLGSEQRVIGEASPVVGLDAITNIGSDGCRSDDDTLVVSHDVSDADSDCGNKLVQEIDVNGANVCTALVVYKGPFLVILFANMENADDLDAVEAGHDAAPAVDNADDLDAVEAGIDAAPAVENAAEAGIDGAPAVEDAVDLDAVEAGIFAEPIVEASNDLAAAVEAGNNPAHANARAENKDENGNFPFSPFLQSCMYVVDNAWDISVEATAYVIVGGWDVVKGFLGRR